MTVVRTRVTADHRISGTVAPAGPAPKFFSVADLPVHDLPWDGSVSLRRKDLHGDDGR